MSFKCKYCQTTMERGRALSNQDVVMGVPDFPDSTPESRGQTMSVDRSKATMINVWKCPECGYSHEI